MTTDYRDRITVLWIGLGIGLVERVRVSNVASE